MDKDSAATYVSIILILCSVVLTAINIFPRIAKFGGAGALVPITSFGHSLIHGALAKASEYGIIGILMGMFDMTEAGISSAIIFSFVFSLFFRPKN